MVTISYGMLVLIILLFILIIYSLVLKGNSIIKNQLHEMVNIINNTKDIDMALDDVSSYCRNTKGIHIHMVYEIIDAIRKKL